MNAPALALPDGWPINAAVIGGGTMGTGVAQWLALAGIPCAVADRTPELAEAAVARALSQAERFESAGLLATGAAATVAGGLRAAANVTDAVADAQFVIEAVAEDPAVKHAVFVQIEDAERAELVIATNTSAIPIRELSHGRKAPERFIGTHWFNPPQWVPCVEVIAGPHTDERVVARVVALLRRLGKQAVQVGDSAGFVANRIQFAMFREAALVVADGIASPEQVDAVVSGSFGFRLPFYGPFAIADMAGLDVYAGAYEALRREFGERMAMPDSIAQNVADGRLGTKTRIGYLEHSEEKVASVAAARDRSYAELARLIARADTAPDAPVE